MPAYNAEKDDPSDLAELFHEYIDKVILVDDVSRDRTVIVCRLCRARHNRHAFATHLLDAGARLEDVSEFMDHSSVDITNRFYGHISQERLDATINLLNRLKLSSNGRKVAPKCGIRHSGGTERKSGKFENH